MAPDSTVSAHELARLETERSLYLRLLRLGSETELDPLLHEALELIVEVSAAKQGYLEIVDDPSDFPGRWWIAHDCAPARLADIRALCSRGVIAEALAKGHTIATSNAMRDPRFRDQASVQAAGIEAVLCAPIQAGPAWGVVYLQGRREPGPFTEQDRERVELFAAHLAPLTDRLLLQHRRRRDADPTLPFRRRLQLEEVTGRSAAMARVFQDIDAIARTDAAVLLRGEPGTGKAQLARAIHDNSDRSHAEFVSFEAGGRSAQEIDSDLFGSSGQDGREGRVGESRGGTLFIRELRDVPAEVQRRLSVQLRGTRNSHHRALRLIASTNDEFDTEDATECRELFAVLNQIRVPSVRERKGDVPELAVHFCAWACRRHQLADLELSRGALAVLESTDWLGNVRQIAHVVEAGAAATDAEGMLEIQAAHLFAGGGRSDRFGQGNADVTFQTATRRFQREFLERRLDEVGWNVSECARRLDIARSHLNARIKAFGIKRVFPD